MANESDVLKALVDDALERNQHPDRENVLREWREENTSEEEREANLTDDERAARDAKRAEEAKSKPTASAEHKSASPGRGR